MAFFQSIKIFFQCIFEVIWGFLKMLFTVQYLNIFTYGFLIAVGLIIVSTLLKKFLKS